jgi:hypothetical protein
MSTQQTTTNVSPYHVDNVMEKMREYAETPEDQKPKECPYSEEERKKIIEMNHKTLSQCPAFKDHKCPFQSVKTMDDIQKIARSVSDLKSRCPAMHENHPNPHGKLMDFIEKQAEVVDTSSKNHF